MSNPYDNKPLLAAQVILNGSDEYEDFVDAATALYESGYYLTLGSTVAAQIESIVADDQGWLD